LYENWAVQSLPYIEEQPLYDSFLLFDEGGGGNALGDFGNRRPRSTELQYMLCPSDMGRGSVCGLSGGNWARGNYGINGGLGFLWEYFDPDGTNATNPWKMQCGRGVATVNRGAKISQIEDGTSKTIMLSEIRVGLSANDRRGTWAMPMVGSNVLMEQASNFALGPNDCSPGADDLRDGTAVISEIGAERLIAECMYPYDDGSWNHSVSVLARSRHIGGVQVAMCDGSVRFISDNVEVTIVGPGYANQCPYQERWGTWQRLNSSNDGYTVDGSSL
jgi:prepilin-type processing-associated H-X9-DG protein